VIQIFQSGQPSHGGSRTIFEVKTLTLPRGTLASVASLLAATLYQGIPDTNHKALEYCIYKHILHDITKQKSKTKHACIDISIMNK
jgi:hypothetical protein